MKKASGASLQGLNLYNPLVFSGGPDGEIGASMRYLSQRYAMPYGMQKGLLTDIGTDAAILRLSGFH